MDQIFPNGVISKIHGKCITLIGDDIDTDRIIPARFLKCVSFNQLGNQVFADDRSELDGHHPFDLNVNKEANILIVNDNFGCGSSREHAPQALMRWGIRGIIGESFAEIFYGNCLALGIPCLTQSKTIIKTIQKEVSGEPNKEWTIDITNKKLFNEEIKFALNINIGPQKMFITGQWDATSQLISNSKELRITEKRLPYLNNFKT